MWELTLPVLLAGMAAALGGGFIDAIAGGGGLVTMPVLLPEEKVKSFTQRITEITAGGVVPAVTGERLKDVPR